MPTLARTSTTDMEVTSIRLERELKERLKELSGNQGYQALIRDVLWNFVHQKSGDAAAPVVSTEIRATVTAIAQTEELCALTGQAIHPHAPMLLGLTANGTLVPLSPDSLKS